MTLKFLSTTLLFTTLILSGCGDTVGERAATGGLGGLAVAGPVGAAAGATAGVVTTN